MEKIPLLSTSTTSANTFSPEKSNGYLLISVSQNEDTSFIQKLNKFGNYSGTIVAVSLTVIVAILIIGVTYHYDVSELTSTNKETKKASSSESFLIQSNNQTKQRHTDVETPLGRLRGYVRQSRKGRDYFAFYKVPYATPPVGNLRFKDPQPVQSWVGLRDFDGDNEPSPSCVQKSKHIEDNIAIGDEDCLYSNIYVPTIDENNDQSQNLAVMVYIHGGGFGDGNGSRYSAEYFMDEDVIIITFQYRLGLFGFLNTGDREATGNMGFKDQVVMLQWVKKYIQFFNGDPNRVTIFGNSMGGFSVSFLVISPMASGLFHQAISQSGTALCESTDIVDLKPEVTKQAVAEAFNCSMRSSVELLSCLQSVDASDLALLQTSNSDIKYALTVEQGFDVNDMSNVFMPDKPYELLKAGKVNPVPYIMGIGSTEWVSAALAVLQNDDLVNDMNTNFHKYAPTLLDMELTAKESKAIQSFYFNGNLISNETERNLTNLLSDRIMVHGTKVTADFHSLVGETYLYYLSKRPAKSYSDKSLINFPNFDKTNSVAHADEVQFLFPYNGYPKYLESDTEYFPFSEFLVKLWATFASTGKPKAAEGSIKSDDWNTVSDSKDSSSWYELNDSPGVTSVLDERMRFWDQFSHKKLMYDQ